MNDRAWAMPSHKQKHNNATGFSLQRRRNAAQLCLLLSRMVMLRKKKFTKYYFYLRAIRKNILRVHNV